MSTQGAPLSQGVGYGVIIGLGAFFAIVVVGISHSLHRFGNVRQSSAEYAVASRSLGVGLTAAGAVSGWTWSVTLLSSCSVAYQYGVAGALIYGAGNMSQVTLFALMAIRMKQKVPHLHTHLELLRRKYGTPGHLTFMFFALATNILVCSSVLIGAAAAINSITDVNIYASLFLLPLAVAAYTLRAGLRGTILADYLHTVIILIILFVLALVTYSTSDIIGSPGRMWELLQDAAARAPSENYAGSYLTLKSRGAIQFGWLSFLEYTGVVFNDASFSQKAIAAAPSAVVPGYILGSLSWFSIPWALATTAGLVALALEQTSPTFPTYPNRMTASEVSAGLVLPYAAKAILGTGGSAAVLLLMFMSATSAISAQLIAVSSIGGYDIYKTYINRNAQPNDVLRVQHYAVVAFTLFIAGFASLLHLGKVDLGLLYNMTGVWSCAALPQMVFSFWVESTPDWAAIAIWANFFVGLIIWLTLGNKFSEEGLTVTSLSNASACIYAFSGAIGLGIIVCTLGSIFTPSKFKFDSVWESRRNEAVDEKELQEIEQNTAYGKENLRKWLIVATVASVIIFAVFMLIWPLSLYRDYVFSESFFRGWVVVSIIWAFFAFLIVGLLPLWDGRKVFVLIGRGIIAKLQGREIKREEEAEVVKEVSDSNTPKAESEASLKEKDSNNTSQEEVRAQS